MTLYEKELKKRENLLHQFAGDMRFLRPGTPVCCNLFGFWEHSGIYLGDGQIAHVTGDGEIESVYPEEFVQRIGNDATEPMLYACSEKTGFGAGSYSAACFARLKIGKSVRYELTKNNCHRFTARCLTGNDDVETCFFSTPADSLEALIKNKLGDFHWEECNFAIDDYDDPEFEEEFAIQRIRTALRDFSHVLGLRKSNLRDNFQESLEIFIEALNGNEMLPHPIPNKIYDLLAAAEENGCHIYRKYCKGICCNQCSQFMDSFFDFCQLVRWLRLKEYSRSKIKKRKKS
ncbi:MAG: hypothetical protein J5858_16480 [Lentisphaeria bacterium]|nr:hypothetical protein [Lentisphaeria bacterium]